MRSAFLFGKLPAHGDFVGRGLSPEEREELDLWLAASLAQAREAVGASFDERYEAAPPWRFVWADPQGWTAGAMALSVDGVGRRYPIVAALRGLGLDEVDGAAEAVETLLYTALEESWDADQLHVALASTPVASLEGWTGGEGWWTLGSDPFTQRHLAGSRPAGLMTAVLTPGQTGEALGDTGGGVTVRIEGGRQDA